MDKTILAFSTAPQEVSQGTFQCMVCAGVPPDLESGLSAKKNQYSHRYLTRGMSNRNYHKIMDAVL